ncbi:3-deoxy-manno-octulosonate cytidylyltransferase [Fluviispira multicolorata]|uniref:3-deoxy-manno-octulosonate cytidylyltransferase n=1 Tax=Fluviispira multicolorata TaxID=2654512 RepID=A0A833N4H8_9BACT|nr:3-deoxy-manno-octulosonate cytidylyltransferase [Fluviispira multicolorata]KAB8028030.1 3-deoxy-manno-octulosonate cytidylyltransferase [Fluviispira multicolorata]
MNKKHLCIIPARMGSSRFPNKPLAKICGIPMIGHIALRACLEPIFDNVVVATCDEEIISYCDSINIKTILTSNKHERATDRTQEATEKLENELNIKFDFITMLQGDEPMVTPQILKKIVETLERYNTPILNLVGKIHDMEEFTSKNCVKITINNNSEALYFSRSPIPSSLNDKIMPIAYKQFGIIGFERSFLDTYSSLKATYLEQIESIDMLRCLENNYKIKILTIDNPIFPVDIKEDILKIEKHFSECKVFDKYRQKFIYNS